MHAPFLDQLRWWMECGRRIQVRRSADRVGWPRGVGLLVRPLVDVLLIGGCLDALGNARPDACRRGVVDR